MFRLVYQPIRALIWNQISKKWVFWSAKLWLNPSIVFFLCLDNWQPTSQVDIRYFQYFHRKLEFVYFVEVMLSRAKVHIKTDSSWIKRCKVNLRHIIFHTFFFVLHLFLIHEIYGGKRIFGLKVSPIKMYHFHWKIKKFDKNWQSFISYKV